MNDAATTILVIEDDEVLRASLTDFLEDWGFRVLATENGRIGLEVFEREHPDLVLTDLRMPEVDGLEVLRHIGARSPETPLIVVSGTGRINDSIQALRLGAWDYIVKPVEEMAVISHAVGRALERARLRRENRAHQENLEALVRERTAELELANRHLNHINERLRKVVETAHHLSVCSDIVKFGCTLLDEFARHMAASGGSLFLVEEGGMRRLHTLESAHVPEFIRFPLPEGSVLQRVLDEEKPLLIKDVEAEEGVRASGWQGYRSGSVLAFPLPDEQDCIVGVLTLHNKTDPPFVNQDLEIGAILASYSCETLRATRMMESLRTSEMRFRDLAEMLPEAVFESDPELNLTFANRRAFELFGYNKEQFANGLNGFDMVIPEDRTRARENAEKRVHSGAFRAIEYVGQKVDGTTFPMLMHMTPILERGVFVGFRGIAVDITEIIRLREEKASIEEQYHQAQKVESIGRLAGGVAHDLNNLLSPILGFAEMLHGDLAQNDERRESVNEILKAGNRAGDLVRQLLAFSRKQALEYRPVDMNMAVANVQKLLRRTIREDVGIEIISSPISRFVLADIGQIEQVILNLCVNAQDAMPEGGKLKLEIATVEIDANEMLNHPDTEPGHYVLLTVSDNGCGMNKETRAHIFEPFFSTKGEQGTGLGLATVYGIVKQHGGNIQVQSEPDIGTTFAVYLPVSDITDTVDPELDGSDTDLTGTETILLVEDNAQVRQLGCAILERQGYTVLPAESGSAALATLNSHEGPLDLLLTDVVMPEMNGKELFEKIVAERTDLKVVFMSGYNNDVIATRGILEDGVNFIQKPFSVRSLAAKLREVLKE